MSEQAARDKVAEFVGEYEHVEIMSGGVKKNEDGTFEYWITSAFWRPDSPNMVDSYGGSGGTIELALLGAIQKERRGHDGR